MVIKRLSYKKIQIEKTVAIFCGDKKIGETVVKCRYKYGPNHPEPEMLPTRDVYYNQLSNKFALKKKFISIRSKSIKVLFEDKEVIIRRCPDFISFDSVEWFISFNRNNILGSLLE